jgi:hypothetical protein
VFAVAATGVALEDGNAGKLGDAVCATGDWSACGMLVLRHQSQRGQYMPD